MALAFVCLPICLTTKNFGLYFETMVMIITVKSLRLFLSHEYTLKARSEKWRHRTNQRCCWQASDGKNKRARERKCGEEKERHINPRSYAYALIAPRFTIQSGWLKRWKEEVQFGSTVYVAKNVRAIVCMCVYSIHYKTLLHCTCVLLNIEDAIRPKKSNNSIHDTAIYRLVWIDNEREKKERNKPYTFVKTYKLPMRYDFLLFLAM